MHRHPALAASNHSTNAAVRDSKTVQLVCLSLILALTVLALRIASILQEGAAFSDCSPIATTHRRSD